VNARQQAEYRDASQADARRDTYRRSSAKRYEDYKRLCASLGARTRGAQWPCHYAELRMLNSDRLKQWWIDRFNSWDLEEMAAAICHLTPPEALAAQAFADALRKVQEEIQ
jgi:hypothetical protein